MTGDFNGLFQYCQGFRKVEMSKSPQVHLDLNFPQSAHCAAVQFASHSKPGPVVGWGFDRLPSPSILEILALFQSLESFRFRLWTRLPLLSFPIRFVLIVTVNKRRDASHD